MAFEKTFQKDNWHREAETIAVRNMIRTRRWGMRVTVYDDPTPSNNGDWVLSYDLDDTDRQNNDNWLKVADIGQTWGGGGGGSSTPGNEYFTGDGVETVFTLAEASAVIQYVEVGGQVMRPGDDYSVSANEVTFVDPPANGIDIGVYYFTDLVVGTDPLEEVEVDSSGPIVTLNMAGEKQRMFVFDTPMATPFAIATDDDGEALVYNFQFEISDVAAVASFDANYTMQSSDTRWDDSSQEFTPDEIGVYEGSAVYDQFNDVWKLKISDPFS